MRAQSELTRRFVATIDPVSRVEFGCAATSIARDEARLAEFMVTGARPLLRLWSSERCLVTTKQISRTPRFAEARADSEKNGWPIFIRGSGGTTVAQRPGILNVSLVARFSGEIDLALAYQPLSDLIVRALGACGVAASAGRVPGSYCDGAYNIVVNNRKIAGTACVVRRAATGYAYLAHAFVWIDGALNEDVDAVARFETALGMRPGYDASALTSLTSEVSQMEFDRAKLQPHSVPTTFYANQQGRE